jgi:hypothetical protein
MPIKPELLKPMVITGVQEKKEASRGKAREYYNRGSKMLTELSEGDTIRIQLPGDKIRTKGIVIKKVGERSYLVKSRVGEYRRNRKDIIKTDEDPPTETEMEEPDLDDYSPVQDQREPIVPDPPQQAPRRSGRVRRPPEWYRP